LTLTMFIQLSFEMSTVHRAAPLRSRSAHPFVGQPKLDLH
jgi:hypothetical protein